MRGNEYCAYKQSMTPLYLLESRMVVAYVDSVISKSGWHLSIHADLVGYYRNIMQYPLFCETTGSVVLYRYLELTLNADPVSYCSLPEQQNKKDTKNLLLCQTPFIKAPLSQANSRDTVIYTFATGLTV